MTIKKQVLISSLILTISVVILIALTFTKLNLISEINNELLMAQKGAVHAGEIKYSTVQIQQFLTDASLVHDADGVKEAEENLKNISAHVSDMSQLYPEYKDQLSEISKRAQVLFDTGVEMYKAYTEKGKEAGDIIMKRENTGLDAASENLSASVDMIVKSLEDKSKTNEKETLDVISTSRMILVIFSVFLLFGLVVIMSLILKRVHPLNEIMNLLESKSDELNSNAHQLSDSSSRMTQSSTTQSSAIQQSASAIEQIVSSSGKTDQNVQTLEKLAEDGKEKVHLGVDTFNTLSEVNEKLQEQIKAFVETVETTNKEYAQTSQIVRTIIEKTKVINDIVFQTKLLSFNASVEAARAGEAGKGFAVVAEEIGNLANMSGQASKEISEILVQSQESVDKLVHKSSQSLQQLIQSTDIILNETIENINSGKLSLDEIANTYNDLFATIQEITNAIREQANGVSEVSGDVNVINTASNTGLKVASENFESSKTIQNSAHQIFDLSKKLNTIINGAA